MTILETERLILRELRTEDKYSLSKVLSDYDSMQYYDHPFNEHEVEEWIKWNIENYATYNCGLWAVILKEDGTFLGGCGITMQNIDGEVLPEIGFHIIKGYCNKGYATEAANACMEYAFDVLGFEQIYSYSTIDNLPSQKVAAKIGMKQHNLFEKNGVHHIVQRASRE
ncbi:GNAT family N-acetyltransferase [Macrococcus equipercicus]|uniref:GNAT family N-acetyltransferase n=1 Tax=Macrococcus equipercicus TaxID=69967 RepID=A0ABQ6R8Q7_9STAP|nr:GNAT family N-acetyltransferase [Macrococcus equipercicus]KAA1039540.1 GNAT family N-acetyltransferase [Macrococcus equipercicus]